ncbi:Lrp/AsnC family transcriptional regulator, leucine-responsive regulatory protein [Chitinophaga sp. CF118]|uniref:Lrp/AsnC family transcriptional regulator n=1 Tax=Chitinophaga sp. CF118 TaxID=1884367 RepID=UPI0008E3716E|nr:Lrp/AsnC family transcriptional regulator [Chitinophaga sp. CF118]SFD01298.1 Lrp/AsnC family transcriptional regulator, leucine-responsive regulatory protein [Chitinophaga sp. CF118]
MSFLPDKTDLCILDLLQDDARLTNKEIAAGLGKSVTSVFERIRKLETEGYIQRYVAILDKAKLGKHLMAYSTITLKEHRHDVLVDFEMKIKAFPEVLECYRVNGSSDYLLKILVADIQEFELFSSNKLLKMDYIGKIQSLFAIAEVKHETSLCLKIAQIVSGK